MNALNNDGDDESEGEQEVDSRSVDSQDSWGLDEDDLNAAENFKFDIDEVPDLLD
jgi:hypothetical protein